MTKLLITSSLLLLFLGLMSASCRQTVDSVSESETPEVEGAVDGEVTLSFVDDGCVVLISVEIDGEKVYYIPVTLDSKFKVEGMKISFTSHPSRINQGSCLMGSPIVIDSIEER